MSTKLFFGGIPTKPEVDALIALLDGKKEGELVSKTEIEDAIGCEIRSSRGGGIVAAWKRRAFRERNIFLVAAPREGYRVADPSERVASSASLIAAGRRRIVRAAVVAETTDHARLDEEGRKLREHIKTIPARLRLAELCAPKG